MADKKFTQLTSGEPFQDADVLAIARSGTSYYGTFGGITDYLTGSAPFIRSVGAEFHSTAVPTATLPASHSSGDILVLVIQTSNQAFSAPTGYTQLGPANGVGTPAAAGATKLCVFWKRDGGSESAPTLSDSGDHTYGFMFAIAGCGATGDPFRILGNNWKFTASTTGTGHPGTIRNPFAHVVTIWAHAIDLASAAQGSSPTNASLTNVTERYDGATSDGTGGGLYMMSGDFTGPGEVAASTVTWATSTVDVSVSLAFIGASAAPIPRGPETMTFIGSPADLDDTWVKPYGARKVFVQLCDGGGSGSGGNITTTAAGGGGGGGGGYDEAWYEAEELAATITVHAGKGGAAGTALNQAGNPGVLSEFNKGGPGPLTSTARVAGTAATAAASADGGNGGCGSGRGRNSPAVSARIDLTSATAGAALGGVGGRGGNGTTAAVGGSPADWGGGGGESGSDTDASISAANNGWSIRGGGGGGGGRTTTNVGNGADGGGGTAAAATQGLSGGDSTRMPYGGAGGNGGGSSTPTGGSGGFPGGGGGGGGGVAGGFGGKGGDGAVMVTTFF